MKRPIQTHEICDMCDLLFPDWHHRDTEGTERFKTFFQPSGSAHGGRLRIGSGSWNKKRRHVTPGSSTDVLNIFAFPPHNRPQEGPGDKRLDPLS